MLVFAYTLLLLCLCCFWLWLLWKQEENSHSLEPQCTEDDATQVCVCVCWWVVRVGGWGEWVCMLIWVKCVWVRCCVSELYVRKSKL